MKILKKNKHRVVTLDVICRYFEKAKQRADQADTKNLVLDNVIMDVKSNGLHEYSATRIGEVCYKLTGKNSGGGETRAGAFASVPCGACPHTGLCSPGGVIFPSTCAYFQKWLDF